MKIKIKLIAILGVITLFFSACGSEPASESEPEPLAQETAIQIGENFITNNLDSSRIDELKFFKSVGGTCVTCWVLTYSFKSLDDQNYYFVKVSINGNQAEFVGELEPVTDLSLIQDQ